MHTASTGTEQKQSPEKRHALIRSFHVINVANAHDQFCTCTAGNMAFCISINFVLSLELHILFILEDN